MAAKRLADKLDISKTPNGKARAAKRPSSEVVGLKFDKAIIVKRESGGACRATPKPGKSRIPNAVSRSLEVIKIMPSRAIGLDFENVMSAAKETGFSSIAVQRQSWSLFEPERMTKSSNRLLQKTVPGI
jgi:hypothetical protein